MSKAWKDKLQNTGVVSVYDDEYTRAWRIVQSCLENMSDDPCAHYSFPLRLLMKRIIK
jgi:hypothetical protein